MDVEQIKQYINKKVLIILRNGFKVTTIIPNFSGNSFNCTDKFGINMTINCDMISMISEGDEK